VIALAHNLSLTLGLSWKGDCGRTCGPAGYFAVFLMFLVLCGGVWLLLQSSFGPLQAYLISSVAFWGSWLVLAIIWFTGVPGIPIDRLPGIEKGIPASTPRYYGPTGTVANAIRLTSPPASRATSVPTAPQPIRPMVSPAASRSRRSRAPNGAPCWGAVSRGVPFATCPRIQGTNADRYERSLRDTDSPTDSIGTRTSRAY